MRTITGIDMRLEYELLRDNVRGITNCSRGLSVFFKKGMIGWIEFLNQIPQVSPMSSLSHGNEEHSTFPKQEFISDMNGVLADILISFNSQQK